MSYRRRATGAFMENPPRPAGFFMRKRKSVDAEGSVHLRQHLL